MRCFVAVLFCLCCSRPTHALLSPLLLANTAVAGAAGRRLADRGTPAVTLDKFARRPWGRMSTVGTLTSFEGGSVEIVRFFFIFPFLPKLTRPSLYGHSGSYSPLSPRTGAGTAHASFGSAKGCILVNLQNTSFLEFWQL